MLNFRYVCLVCVSIVAVSASSASAALIRIADPTYPFIIYDTETNLEWLSPAITQALTHNQSVDQVAAEFGVGGIYEGFRHATLDDINTLFYVSAGMTPNEPNEPHDPPEAGAKLMQELFGHTFAQLEVILDGYFDDGSANGGLAGVFRWRPDPIVIPLPISPNGVFPPYFDPDLNFTYSGTRIGHGLDSGISHSAEFGHWLVRDSTIPEPSTIAIWSVLGLVGMGVGWRRSKLVRRSK